MEVPVRVGKPDLGGIDLVQPVDLADFRGDVIVQALQGVAHVGVLIDLPVGTLQIPIDEVDVGARDDLADPCVLLAVDDVRFRRCPELGGEENLFHDVLYLLDGRDASRQCLMRQVEHAKGQLSGGLLVEFRCCLACAGDGGGDLVWTERDNYPVTLFY